MVLEDLNVDTLYDTVVGTFFELITNLALYGAPALLAFLVLLFGVLRYYYLKKFNLEILILNMMGDDALIWTRDVGAEMEDKYKKEVLRLRRLKQDLYRISKKYWIPGNKGRFMIMLLRYGTDDYAIIDPITKTLSVPQDRVIGLKEKVRDWIDKTKEKIVEGGVPTPMKIGEYHILDIKTPVVAKTIDFKPVESQQKNFYFQQGREIAKERDQRTAFEKNASIFLFIAFGVLIIAFLYFYFQYAGALSDKEFNCINPGAAKQFIQAIQEGTAIPAVAPTPPAVAPSPFLEGVQQAVTG